MNDDADDSALSRFQREIDRQEDILYGIALFFEGINLLYSGQTAVVETYRKQFRNIIQTGNATIQHARELLQAAERDPASRSLLESYSFHPGQGHPDPDALVRRAKVLVESYATLFPERPRDQAMTENEALQLIESAAQRLGGSIAIENGARQT